MAQLQNISDTCGYTDYVSKYLTYPPKDLLPFPAGVNPNTTEPTPHCDIFGLIYNEISMLVQGTLCLIVGPDAILF